MFFLKIICTVFCFYSFQEIETIRLHNDKVVSLISECEIVDHGCSPMAIEFYVLSLKFRFILTLTLVFFSFCPNKMLNKFSFG